MQSVKSLSTVNRILIGASMLSAAGLTVLSFALTPWEGDLTGGDYFRSLAEYPTQASLAATVPHTGYLRWPRRRSACTSFFRAARGCPAP